MRVLVWVCRCRVVVVVRAGVRARVWCGCGWLVVACVWGAAGLCVVVWVRVWAVGVRVRVGRGARGWGLLDGCEWRRGESPCTSQ